MSKQKIQETENQESALVTEAQDEISTSRQSELLNKKVERAISKDAKTSETLNDSFSYKLVVENNALMSKDGVNLNDKGKRVNSVIVEIDSTEAKKQIKSITGINFDDMLKETKKLDARISARVEDSLASELKKLGKQLLTQ